MTQAARRRYKREDMFVLRRMRTQWTHLKLAETHGRTQIIFEDIDLSIYSLFLTLPHYLNSIHSENLRKHLFTHAQLNDKNRLINESKRPLADAHC